MLKEKLVPCRRVCNRLYVCVVTAHIEFDCAALSRVFKKQSGNNASEVTLSITDRPHKTSRPLWTQKFKNHRDAKKPPGFSMQALMLRFPFVILGVLLTSALPCRSDDTMPEFLRQNNLVKKLSEKGKLSTGEKESLSNLYFAGGDLSDAKPLTESILTELEKKRPGESLARAQNNFALVDPDPAARASKLKKVSLNLLSGKNQLVVLDNLGKSLYDAGKLSEAESTFKQLLNSPDSDRGMTVEEKAVDNYLLGEVLIEQHKNEEGQSFLSKAMDWFLRSNCPDRIEPPCHDADLKGLKNFIVELANHGKFATEKGKFHSDPAQIEAIFANMNNMFASWEQNKAGSDQHILLYAHGGLNSEEKGLCIAQRHTSWLLENHIYPISFVWHSGLGDALGDLARDEKSELIDSMNTLRATGNMRFCETFHVNDYEKFSAHGGGLFHLSPPDKAIEFLAGGRIRPIWNKMKQNAEEASTPLLDGMTWDQILSQKAEDLYGASVFAKRLGIYLDQCQKQGINVHLHLFGHSAGAVLHGELLARLEQENIPVDSIFLAAPANRVDKFQTTYVPYLRKHNTCKLTIFQLSPEREKHDSCSACGFGYHKSLLYFVSRALEKESDVKEVPLLGMEKFDSDATHAANDDTDPSKTISIEYVIAPEQVVETCQSDAKHHGGFADDQKTMDCIACRILRTQKITEYPIYTIRP